MYKFKVASLQHRSSPLNLAQEFRRRLRVACLGLMFLPAIPYAANVTVNVSSNLDTVGGAVFGMGTAIYDNINGDPALPGRIMAVGGQHVALFWWRLGRHFPLVNIPAQPGYRLWELWNHPVVGGDQ